MKSYSEKSYVALLALLTSSFQTPGHNATNATNATLL